MSSVPVGDTSGARLVDAMRQIRDRCVWTQGIDHRMLVPYLIEESYELVEAVEAGSREDLVEELGDVLWQVVFHAEIASRDPDAPFDFDDVAEAVTRKMVHRHPHVFGDEQAPTPEDVLRVWNAAKATEKAQRASALEGIPQAMPSLALADKVLGRAASLGVRPEPEAERFADEDALGNHLLAVVAAAKADGLDAERALRTAVRRLSARVLDAERPGAAPTTADRDG
ncbi:nucleoside triphosphate hydrolase [Plantibacter sp. Leaf171]|uniref:MazG family protein n=1 Tax=unclassified Plantibacter TaxID=2624265 RepID=UPI0006FA9017|nr:MULTISPECIES: MazG family protein [unclassified Plantibacter]KQM15635.1 nucleoside triphosphate hydrolase [Plantibacter sp. Leaf1]KQR58779.1 nucleoside triphosphate hydrolase [Plantibacter sp. Leaf171]